MSNQGKLIKQGLRPVFRSILNQKWRRVLGDVTTEVDKNQFQLKWQHVFEQEENDTVFFAYTYPYSYTESLNKTQKMMKRLENSMTYMHREVLCHSVEGREMEIITLSSYKGITDDREPHIENCLPLGEERPFMF